MHYKDADGRIAHRKRAIDPYVVPVAADEMDSVPKNYPHGDSERFIYRARIRLSRSRNAAR